MKGRQYCKDISIQTLKRNPLRYIDSMTRQQLLETIFLLEDYNSQLKLKLKQKFGEDQLVDRTKQTQYQLTMEDIFQNSFDNLQKAISIKRQSINKLRSVFQKQSGKSSKLADELDLVQNQLTKEIQMKFNKERRQSESIVSETFMQTFVQKMHLALKE